MPRMNTDFKRRKEATKFMRGNCCSNVPGHFSRKFVTFTPGVVLPYMGYLGMCGAKGYGFSAVLVINRVSLLAILPPFW